MTEAEIVANEATEAAELKATELKATELKATSKKEALRELSKEFGFNAFEPSEIKTKFNEFTDWQKSQLTEQENLQAKIDLHETEKSAWQTEKLDYQSQLEASKLGINPDKIKDALLLAGGDPSKLAEVIKTYPIFKSKDGITIGLTNPKNHKTPTDRTELEAYMASNPMYKNYTK